MLLIKIQPIFLRRAFNDGLEFYSRQRRVITANKTSFVCAEVFPNVHTTLFPGGEIRGQVKAMT